MNRDTSCVLGRIAGSSSERDLTTDMISDERTSIKHSPKRTGLNLMGILISFLLVAAFVAVSNAYCDADVANFFRGLLGADTWLARRLSHIPDLLFPVVSAITAFSWMAYFYLRKDARRIDSLRLFQLIGTSVPLSVISSLILKHAFGRVNTQAWLFNPDLYEYHWFQGGPHYMGFPSGHMAVLTALVAAMSHFHPRYQMAYTTIVFLLGVALIATHYHFLSDVVAGAYLGAMVHYMTYHCLPSLRKST
jgi:membrane-associated phospholipid phosphatase